jgi:hypothetical protein
MDLTEGKPEFAQDLLDHVYVEHYDSDKNVSRDSSLKEILVCVMGP